MPSHDVSEPRARTGDRGPTPRSEPLGHPDDEGYGRIPTTFSPGIGRRLKLLAGVFMIGLLLAFIFVHFVKSRFQNDLAAETELAAAAPPKVVATDAAAAPATALLTLPGETAAWYTSTIYARVDGYVGDWHADIGDRVKKGQVLATIDTPDLDAQLAAAQAKLKVANAEVKVREAEVDFAKTTYERWRNSPKGVVSDQEREDKKARYASAEAQLNAAHAQVDLTQGDVERLSAFEAFKQVTAPFDGTIIERNIDIGNLVTAGSGANRSSLYRVAQNDPMRVFIDAPQSVAGEMKPGVAADITTPDRSGQIFRGRIARTADAINQQARTLRVEVDLANPKQDLVPGMYVQIAFELEPKGAVQVPAAALQFRSSGPQVAVVTADKTIQFRHVTIARDDGSVVEIGSGLSAGDPVVLNISSQIRDGDKVAVSYAVEAAIAVQPKPDGPIEIPVAALVSRAGTPEVAVIVKAKSEDEPTTVRFRPVTVQRRDGTTAEITSGLAKDDIVVLNVNGHLSDGDQVTITSTAASKVASAAATGR